MKYLLSIFILLMPLAVSFASELSEYENHYKNMNRLKGELEQLELEKKIQMVENEIYESKQSLKESKKQKVTKAAIKNDEKFNSGFNPSEARLLYIIGSGKHIKAVLSFNEITQIVYNDSIYYGWRVKIRDKEVSITKGKEVIKL